MRLKRSAALTRLNLSGGMPDQDALDQDAPDLEPLDIPVPEFDLLLSARPRAGSIVGSLGAHGIAGATLILIAPWLEPDRLPNYAVRRVPISSIELLLPPLQAPTPPSPQPAATRASRSTRAAKRSRPAAPAPAAPAAPARPKFELPPMPVRQDTELTLLQPPSEVDVPIRQDLRMPTIMQWSVIPKAKLPPKRFVTPGNTTANRQVPQLEAPPKLEAPNAMPAVRDLKMAVEIVMDRPPALPVQRATTMPVRTFVPPQPTAPTAPAALQMIDGDALNLVAIAPPSVKALGSIPLPPGSQIAAMHDVKAPPNPVLGTGATTETGRVEAATEAGDSARVVTGRGPANASGTGAGATPSARGTGEGAAGGGRAAQGTGTGRATAPAKGGSGSSGSATAAGSGPAGASGATAGTGTQVVALASGAGAGAATEMLPRSSVPIRIEHPETRTFDVVVVQSSATPNAAAAGILSGSPVYTVYVPVGARATWVMQYCVPKESAIQKREGIAIQLGNPAPVKAPYPRVTVVPPLGGRERVVMHGFITELGEFQDLRVVSGEKAAEDLMVLPLLKRWTFRPATRDGRPVMVEIVLVVPAERG